MKLFCNSKSIPIFILTFFIFSGCSDEKTVQNTNSDEAIELEGNWYSFEEAQTLAAENGKKVLIYAEASWCPYCKQMKREVFPLEDVQQVKEKYFYPVRVDIESEDSLTYQGQRMTEAQFSRQMNINFTPTFIFFNSDAEIIATQPGYFPPDKYIKILEFVGSDAYLDQNFEDFLEL